MLWLLGPMELVLDDRPVDLGPAKQRTVLALLAADAGRLVAWPTLIDGVWDHGTVPTDPRRVLYTYINGIRRTLERSATATASPVPVLVRRSGGYVLETDPEQVDLHRFRRLVAESADTSRTDADRAGLLADALG